MAAWAWGASPPPGVDALLGLILRRGAGDVLVVNGGLDLARRVDSFGLHVFEHGLGLGDAALFAVFD